LYDLHEGKILFPQERYYEWLEVADHFGLWKLRYLLEDAIFRTFDPENFSLFESVVQKKMRMDQNLVLAIRDIVGSAFKRAGLMSFTLTNRKKNIYGVYKKIALKKMNINEIFDVHGFRILVSNTKKCYQALEILHRLWPNVPERYKDYIEKPKANGYQSIHTVLSCLEKKPIEFQIRTREMDLVAASGPANHAEYKKARGSVTFGDPS
jgi:GTP pyrophosphokinase